MKQRHWLGLAIVVFALALALAACGSTPPPGRSAPQQTAQGPTIASEPSSVPTDGRLEKDLVIEAPAGAVATGFEPMETAAPADTALTITFNNNDTGIPHNIQLFAGTAAAGTPVFAPTDNATITGVATTAYSVDALEAGTYTWSCFIHPAMTGTLTVSPRSS